MYQKKTETSVPLIKY